MYSTNLLEKRSESLNNQLRILLLQNIREDRFDKSTLIALNALTRELLRVNQIMANGSRIAENYQEIGLEIPA